MAFLLILDARLVPKAVILSHVPTVRIYETECQVPSYKRSTRLVMGETTRYGGVFRVLRCFLPCTTGIPLPSSGFARTQALNPEYWALACGPDHVLMDLKLWCASLRK